MQDYFLVQEKKKIKHFNLFNDTFNNIFPVKNQEQPPTPEPAHEPTPKPKPEVTPKVAPEPAPESTPKTKHITSPLKFDE